MSDDNSPYDGENGLLNVYVGNKVFALHLPPPSAPLEKLKEMISSVIRKPTSSFNLALMNGAVTTDQTQYPLSNYQGMLSYSPRELQNMQPRESISGYLMKPFTNRRSNYGNRVERKYVHVVAAPPEQQHRSDSSHNHKKSKSKHSHSKHAGASTAQSKQAGASTPPQANERDESESESTKDNTPSITDEEQASKIRSLWEPAIEKAKEELAALEKEISSEPLDSFEGTSEDGLSPRGKVKRARDKQARYISESLLQVLLKLDGVSMPPDFEKSRAARKEGVVQSQKILDHADELKSKVLSLR